MKQDRRVDSFHDIGIKHIGRLRYMNKNQTFRAFFIGKGFGGVIQTFHGILNLQYCIFIHQFRMI